MPVRCFVLLAVPLCALMPAQDWREFRGPNRAGTARAVALPLEFDANKNLAWSVEVPMGRSSPIISGHKLFLTGATQNELLVIAYDTRSGKAAWRHSMPRVGRSEIDALRNDPASPTPVTDGRAVYAFFADFGVVAISVDGEPLWKLPLPAFLNNYGMASSPVINGDTLYLQCDQTRGSFIIAVNVKDGSIRWRKDRDGVLEGWATPLILDGFVEVVALSSSGLEALDCKTGQTRWSVPASGGLMIPAPITDGESVIATFRGSDQPTFPSWQQTLADLDMDKDDKISPPELAKRYHPNSFGLADPDRNGFITESEWVALRNRGVGDFGITRISLRDKRVMWRYARGLPYVPSPVLYGDVLYSIRNGGVLTALDVATGQVLKEGRLPEALGDYFASPIASEGKLYFANAEGRISVVRAGPDWQVLRVNDLREPVSATPAIADGALFVRTHHKLYCFRVQ